ncbi:pectinesterase family protein [Geofilum sp. OHC36d9]|uniref:pectinesterase family protein n=1 Tax=Geofilum sp. OHC36d9 TaxID=3458413 RepID=UPI004033EEFB
MTKKRLLLTFTTLFMGLFMTYGQLSGTYTYDFTDGTIITDGQSTDGKLALSGDYSYHGTTYGLNMKIDATITLTIDGAATIRFLGSKYSNLQMIGTAIETGDLGTQNTAVTNDLTDTYDFVYNGAATTLTFTTSTGTGNDLYLPVIEVIPAQLGATATTAEKNIIYSFDLRDESIIPADTEGNIDIESGLFKIEPGVSNAFDYNGTTHGSILKTGNKITLQVGGNTTIRFGGCQYSNGTITATSSTGEFETNSQPSQTTECYHTDGSTVDFLYVGTAGTVEFTFEGTTYIPIIELVPVPYDVELSAWVQKTGTITINGTEITFTAGTDVTTPPSVTVSNGLIISTTTESASIRIDLNGETLSSFTPILSGDIEAVNINGGTLEITFADESTSPTSYTLQIADNSITAEAEAGQTYTYSFTDGSEMPQTSYSSLRYSTFITNDAIVTINSNTETTTLQFGYHDSSHGAVLFSGNSIDFVVAGDATITFNTCQYGSAIDAIYEFTDSEGSVLGSTVAHNIGTGACGTNSFSYEGEAGIITATLKSTDYPSAEIYLHGVSIQNMAASIPSNGKVDVWDFGAQQLDEAIYNNHLTETIINTWYSEEITPGSSAQVLPNFSSDILSWVGGGNDRLRTTNTNLTRYDENIAGATDYTGRIYVNSAANTGRYLSLALKEDDEVTIVTKTDAGGRITFEYVNNPEAQTDATTITSDITTLQFVAKSEGVYHLFDDQGKPSYYRIYRKNATYLPLTGSVDITEATDIPAGYSVVFTNEAGKMWQAPVSEEAYSVNLPMGYTYQISLSDANGYIISNENSLEITETTTTHNISIKKVELYTLSGNITGLDDYLQNLSLKFIADPSANKIYIPEPQIDIENGTYSVQLEANSSYTIVSFGVNDFVLTSNTISMAETDQTSHLTFDTKTKYNIDITTEGLTTAQTENLTLTFSNLYEEGYSYTFAPDESIALRNGTYVITASGLDAYPVKMALTSNLIVNSENTTKVITFEPIKRWSFDDKVISGTAYNGLLLSGTIGNEIAKGHMTMKPDATVQIPVESGEKITITYYYSADFSIDGGETFTTNSGSTSTFESTAYTYPGNSAGYVTITAGPQASTTYITDIKVSTVMNYQSELEVGADKPYQTINEALDAIRSMERPDNERVTVLIDAGNYEEMLIIDTPNITFKNASATPSTAIVDKGVNIAEGAVRITSYYGHGYDYYSMGNDQKWNAEILRVNKENGYLSYNNAGAGTTNGSYWNATVVVSANGFEAEQIIFENSFNQYISQKESEDVVVMWESGSKGQRPTDAGNTSVQEKSFVERAAAIAITNNTDKIVLNKCRVIGRQDSFFGGSNSRVVVYKGAMMGATDYLFGGMAAVFYKTDLVMNTSDASTDLCYITAAQQTSGRGYLMYECTIKSAIPEVETASVYGSKPGYLGRPWQATTSEVVFYNTTIQTSEYPGFEDKSLINAAGWLSTLGGESDKMYEFGTIEASGEDNQDSRASWSTLLSSAILNDGTPITAFNFTKGNDDWDPIQTLVDNDTNVGIVTHESNINGVVYAINNHVYIKEVTITTTVNIYSVNGYLYLTKQINGDSSFETPAGVWLIETITSDGRKITKVITH